MAYCCTAPWHGCALINSDYTPTTKLKTQKQWKFFSIHKFVYYNRRVVDYNDQSTPPPIPQKSAIAATTTTTTTMATTRVNR
jgi:hypothetical protein